MSGNGCENIGYAVTHEYRELMLDPRKMALLDCQGSSIGEDTHSSEVPDGGPARLLGVHKSEGSYWCLHYVGAVWVRDRKEKFSLIVNPKITDGEVMLDAVAMLEEAVSFPRYFESSEFVSREPVFTLFDDQEEISARESMTQELSLFQVVWYLKELAVFCQRNLRQAFTSIDDNLVGKVKGRVLLEQQIRSNTPKGRGDRMFCRFPTMTIDSVHNRVLRYALTLSCRYLNNFYRKPVLDNVWLWVRQAEAALSEVLLTSISPQELKNITYSGSHACYKQIHRLAKAVITNIRMNADGTVSSTGRVIPFAVNMNTLYEAYAGALMEKAGYHLKPQVSMTVEFGITQRVCFRPDFCSPCGRLVVDAKYKRYVSTESDDRVFQDLSQLLAYSLLTPVGLRQISQQSQVPGSEHWAFLIVPCLKKGQKHIPVQQDGFPVPRGSIIEVPLPNNGKVKAVQVECPVPTTAWVPVGNSPVA